MDSKLYRPADGSYISWDQPFHVHNNGAFKEIVHTYHVSWRGATWHILMQKLQDSESKCGAFVVCGSIEDEDPQWTCNMEFSFSLLDKNDVPTDISQSSFFQFYRYPPGHVLDRGFSCLFLGDQLKEHRRHDGTCVLRCELLPQLPMPPPNSALALESKATTGMVGLENLGATCYLNALLQMLFHINTFRKEVYDLPHEQEEMATSTTLALQNVFYKIQRDDSSVSTVGLTKSFGWNSADAFQQQDVQEMMRILIDKLEECMKGSQRESALKNTFSGTIRSYIKCLNVDYVSQREEDFYDIQLDVSGNADIYQSFRKYIAKEILDGDNQYDAGDGRGKQDAVKGVVFTKFPPVLTVHLKRFAFNVQKMGFTKIHDEFKYPTVLDLNPFLDPDIAATGDPSDNIYRLHSVLIHAGEVYGGHYYAFIRAMPCIDSSVDSKIWLGEPPEGLHDLESLRRWREKRAKWFKFDDERVTPVSQEDAVKKSFGRSIVDTSSTISRTELIGTMSSAYMLVYIRERDANNIMCPITESDVPPSLCARLEAEEVMAKFKETLFSLKDKTIDIQYVTSDDASAFTRYSADSDFINIRSASNITLLRGSKKLALLLAIARKLNKLPDSLRLWVLRQRGKKRTYRPFSVISTDDLMTDLCSGLRYRDAVFVELLRPTELYPNRSLVSETFQNLLNAESMWIESLVSSLKTLFDVEESDEAIVKQFCGFGVDDTVVSLIKGDCGRDLIARGDKLFRDYLDALGAYPSTLYAADGRVFKEASAITCGSVDDFPILLIFKIFDPVGILVENRSAYMKDGSECKDKCPIFYCGTRIFRSADSLSSLLETCDDLLKNFVSRNATEWDNYSIFQIQNPRIVKEIIPNQDIVLTRIDQLGLECGDIICLQAAGNSDMVVSNRDALLCAQSKHDEVINGIRPMHVPIDDFAEVEKWLLFQANRILLQLSPYHDSDDSIAKCCTGAWKYLDASEVLLQGSYEIPFETSAAISGKDLLVQIAKIVHAPSYRFIMAALSRTDAKKDVIYLQERDLTESLAHIFNENGISLGKCIVYFSVLPFDDILYGAENDCHKSVADGTLSMECLSDCGNELVNTNKFSAAKCEFERHRGFQDDDYSSTAYLRYPEILLISGSMQVSREKFIREELLGSNAMDLIHSKKQKVDLRANDNSTGESVVFLFSTQSLPICTFPEGLEVLHDGFVEADRIYLKLRCEEGAEFVESVLSKLKCNMFSAYDESFRTHSSILRANVRDKRQIRLPSDESLPLTVREIFSITFPEGNWSEAISGMAQRRKTEIAQNWYRYNRTPNAIILDYFSEKAPSIMELAVSGDSSSWDSRTPLILLYFVFKKRIKFILQHHMSFSDSHLSLPKSRVDCIRELVMEGEGSRTTALLSIAAQFITREDEMWMRGLCPIFRSMAISIYCAHRSVNGTLTSAVGPIAPCLSYVTEADSIGSLLSRIASVVCGPSESEKHANLCEILLRHEIVAMFIAVDSTGKEITVEVSNGIEAGRTSDLIWKCFELSSCNYDSNASWTATSTLKLPPEVIIILPNAPSPLITRKRKNAAAGIKIR